ncbi:MAG: hypothetical protein EOM19_00115 [Candidatus Moranbacteria bacterium]|nr:hypothetical protein [Candidatus Moranbacteria bacterium]
MRITSRIKIKFEGRGTDPEGSVASWELFVNGTRVLSKAISPPSSPIISSPVYTLDTDNYPAGPITVKFSVRDVLGLEAIVSETVVLGNKITPINGSCGTASKTYTSTQTAYTGTFCSAGTVSPTSPAFPAPGASTSWQCLGQKGGINVSCSATRQPVTPPPPPPVPTLTFTADSTNIPYNTATTLRWTSTSATSCTATNAWTGAKAVNGNQSTGNLTSVKTYILTCTGTGGSVSKSVTVNVSTQPALTLKNTNCSGPTLSSLLEIETSKTIAVCDGTTPVNPASWNISPVSQTAFTVAGSNTDATRTFTALGDDGNSITIQATKTGYLSSSQTTLRVKKDPFSPPVLQKGEDQWKEIAP